VRADVGAVRDCVNATVPAPDDSYADLSQERWRDLAPYLRAPRPGGQPRRPRAFFHRVLAPAAALLVVAAILGGVFALSHNGKSSSSTITLAAKGSHSGAPEAAPGAATGALHMASPVSQGPLAADYDTVVVARAGQVSGAQQRFTVLRTLKGRAPQTLRLHSEGGTLPPDWLAILYLRPAISAAGPGETLGLFGGLQARGGGVGTSSPASQPAGGTLTQRVLTPEPAASGFFGPASLPVTPYVFRHLEALAVPLPPGTKADKIRLP